MDTSLEFDLTTLLAGGGILLVIFIIGVFLQIKIIKAIRQDRATAWEVDLGHSIVMMIHFSFIIFFNIITYIYPNLHLFIGKEFCYIALFLRMLGLTEIVGHSLVISFYKYIFIVHHNTITRIGQDRMKKILLLIYIINPLTGSLSYIFRPNLKAFKDIEDMCPIHTSNKEPKIDTLSRLFMCGYDELEWNNGYDYFSNILLGLFCSCQTIVAMLTYTNIMEMFFYIGIFRHIGR